MAFCEERHLLVEQYATVTKAYSDAVAALRTSPDRLDEATRITEEARNECIKGRRALKHHREEHGC
jgi:hypothetical protein